MSLLDGNLYFTANTYFNGRQILKLDGSGLNVTEMIGSSGEATAKPSDLYASRDQLFFSADNPGSNPRTNTVDALHRRGINPDRIQVAMIAASGLGETLQDIDYNEKLMHTEKTRFENLSWVGWAV